MNTPMKILRVCTDCNLCAACGSVLVCDLTPGPSVMGRKTLTVYCWNGRCTDYHKILRIPMPIKEIDAIWNGEEYT